MNDHTNYPSYAHERFEIPVSVISMAVLGVSPALSQTVQKQRKMIREAIRRSWTYKDYEGVKTSMESKRDFSMGERGEGWAILQLVLLLIILTAPRMAGGVELPFWLRALGGVIIIAAGIIIILGMVALGKNLTPFPRPVPSGQLITNGIYGVVRHPLYMAVIFGTLGWGLLTANMLVIGLVAVVFLFVDLKSRREERWLMEAYPEYASYRRRVKKLIPWIY